MLYSAIDIGTNTVLLLIARPASGDALVSLLEEQRMPRLGREVDSHRQLHPASVERVMKALEEYQTVLQHYEEKSGQPVSGPVLTATSAVRDAGNRAAFLAEVKKRTGWKVRLLTGDEEARFTFRGALSVLALPAGNPVMVLDIGGGSTETAYGYSGAAAPTHFRSVDAGCVRFTERYLSGPAFEARPEAQVQACFEAARSCFAELSSIREAVRGAETPVELVGVAGTLTSLAVMQEYEALRDIKGYEAARLNGIMLRYEEVQHWRQRVFEAGPERLLQDFPLVMQGRADIYLAGLIILEAFMQYFELPSVVVSTGGIRHGAVLYAQDDAARS